MYEAAWPVMALLSSLPRNRARSAISSGRIVRPSAAMSDTCSRVIRPMPRTCSNIGVSTTPGQMQLARTPLRPYSIATVRVRLIKPAFAVQYGAFAALAARPYTDEVEMIDPLPCSTMCGSAACMPWSGPLSITDRLASKPSRSRSATYPPVDVAALLKITSIRPWSRTHRSTAART